MLAHRFSRMHETPVRYAVNSTAFNEYLRQHTRAYHLPYLLNQRRLKVLLGEPALGLAQDTVQHEMPAPHILGDALQEHTGDNNILSWLRQFHGQIAPTVAGYMGSTPETIRQLAAWHQAQEDPAILRHINRYLDPRKRILDYLLDHAARHGEIYADFDNYRDNHTPDSLVSIYDAMNDLRRSGFQPRRKMDTGNGLPFREAVPEDQGVVSGATQQMHDVSGYMRRHLLPRLNAAAGIGQ